MIEALSTLLLIIGCLLIIVGNIWFLFAAFDEGILWGLACLFIPLVSLVFLIMHWEKASKPFVTSLVGLGIALCGMVLGGEFRSE